MVVNKIFKLKLFNLNKDVKNCIKNEIGIMKI